MAINQIKTNTLIAIINVNKSKANLKHFGKHIIIAFYKESILNLKKNFITPFPIR